MTAPRICARPDCAQPIPAERQRAMFCSDTCGTMVSHRRRVGMDDDGRHPARPCERCGEPFRPQRSLGRFCSHQCAQRASTDRHRDKVNAKRRRPAPSITCAVCGTVFTATRLSRMYCSEACLIKAPAHRARRRATYGKYRARKKGATVERVTAQQEREVRAMNGGMCVYCGGCAGLTIDHVDPLAQKGPHAVDNFLPACKSCNSSKSDRTPVEWRGRECRKCGGVIVGLGAEVRVTTAQTGGFASLITAVWREMNPQHSTAQQG